MTLCISSETVYASDCDDGLTCATCSDLLFDGIEVHICTINNDFKVFLCDWCFSVIGLLEELI